MNKKSTQYPSSFELLRSEVRVKAISIANELICKEFNKEVAYAVAFFNARQWANYHFNNNLSHRENTSVHLIPHPQGWALTSEDGTVVYFMETVVGEAISKARSFAKNHKVKMFIHTEEGLFKDCESFEVNKPFVKSYNLREAVSRKDASELKVVPKKVKPGFVSKLVDSE
ncbi:MAG TPA: DUF2188 domain-containing protein [Cytophagaceae bacterium]